AGRDGRAAGHRRRPELARPAHRSLALAGEDCQGRVARPPGLCRMTRSGLALPPFECESRYRNPSTEEPSMKLKPLGDRLIVRAIEEEETTASGIVLPDTAKEKPQKGEVIAVGDGRYDDEGEKRIPLDAATGATVLSSKYGGTEIKVDGEDLLVLRESDVLAKVEAYALQEKFEIWLINNSSMTLRH